MSFKLNEYMLITEAAEFLGVSTGTLRNWERAKKIKVFRNPINKYRMYKKKDLEKLLNGVGQ